MPEAILTIRESLNRAHHALMAQDEAIVCVGEDIAANGGVFGVTGGLLDAFGPARVIDTPISETAFVGMSVGAAMTGLKPIVEIMFCDFIGVCFDQIMNQAAKAPFLSDGRFKMPLVIRMTMGAGDGSGAMHSQSLHGLLAAIPGLAVMCPSTPADAAGLLKSALASDGPVIFMEHKGLYDFEQTAPDSLPPVPVGKAAIARAGNDLTIVAASAMAHAALDAAASLEQEGISAEVIDPRTIKPLDVDAIADSVQRTGRLMVVDEGAAFGGFADAVIAAAATCAFSALKAPPRKVCPPDAPVPYATAAERAWLPGADDVRKAASEMMKD